MLKGSKKLLLRFAQNMHSKNLSLSMLLKDAKSPHFEATAQLEYYRVPPYRFGGLQGPPYSFRGNHRSELNLSLATRMPCGLQALDMTNALQSALHLAPLPAHAWETTDDMFKAVDGYLNPAIRLT